MNGEGIGGLSEAARGLEVAAAAVKMPNRLPERQVDLTPMSDH
jgi:hypothetical protein